MEKIINIEIPFAVYIEYKNNFRYDSYFTDFKFISIECMDFKAILYHNGIANIFTNNYIYQFETNLKNFKLIVDKQNFYFYNFNTQTYISPNITLNYQLANFIKYKINEEVNKLLKFDITPVSLSVI